MVEKFYTLEFPMVKNKLLNKVLSVWNHLLQFILQKTYPHYYERKNKDVGVTDRKYDAEIVVSLTTFPARIDSVKYTLETILSQTMRPNKIYLWLCTEEFKGKSLPSYFEELKRRGVEICFTDLNLKPHNKSYHTAALDSNRIIITVDDDIFYSEKLIENLYKEYMSSDKKTVICELAHKIVVSDNGKSEVYSRWIGEARGFTGPSHLLMAKGVGGVLYPPGFFSGRYFDVNAINSMCPTADDLWLKMIAIQNGFTVKKRKKYAKNIFMISGSQIVTLNSINNGEHKNDEFWVKLCDANPDINWNMLQ